MVCQTRGGHASTLGAGGFDPVSGQLAVDELLDVVELVEDEPADEELVDEEESLLEAAGVLAAAVSVDDVVARESLR